jgi:streptogramin lyase
MRWANVLAVILAALVPLAAGAGVPEVRAKIATGREPCGATLSLGSVWVANDGSGTLARIDPRRNRVTARIPVARGICPIAAAGGKLWVASYETGLVYRVDPRLRRVVSRFKVGAWPAHFAVSGRTVYLSVFELGLIVRFHARTGRFLGAFSVQGHNPSGLAVSGGKLWVAFAREAVLGRIDLQTGHLEQFALRHDRPGFLTKIAGELWTTTGDGLVLRIDPETGSVRATFAVAGTPADVASSGGLIWIADKERSRIVRVDPSTNRVVDVLAAGRGAYSVLAAAGDIWVTSYAGSDVWRFRG